MQWRYKCPLNNNRTHTGTNGSSSKYKFTTSSDDNSNDNHGEEHGQVQSTNSWQQVHVPLFIGYRHKHNRCAVGPDSPQSPLGSKWYI